jgi:hypothetical protein
VANVPHLFHPPDYWDGLGMSTRLIALVLPIIRRIANDIFDHMCLVCRPRGGHSQGRSKVPTPTEISRVIELHLYGDLLQMSTHVRNLLCIVFGNDDYDILSARADCSPASSGEQKSEE